MRKVCHLLLLVLALGGAVYAQSVVPFTIDLQRLTGDAPLDRTVFHIQLAYCPAGDLPRVMQGSTPISLSDTSQDIAAPTNGSISGTLWPNDVITCGHTMDGTRYLVSITRDGATLWGPAQFHITGSGTYDFDTAEQDVNYTAPLPLAVQGYGAYLPTTDSTAKTPGNCGGWDSAGRIVDIGPCSGSGTPWTRHTPTETPNGSNEVFHFAGQAGSNVRFELFWNGLSMSEADDYTISISGGQTTVTCVRPPAAGDKIYAYY